MKLFSQAAFIMVLCWLQGCATTNNSYDNFPMQNLIIAEPLPVNYKSEIAIARLSEVIQRADITDDQRAQLFYDRGVIYDSVGLRSLARLDFNRALRLKPNLVDAYNFLGIHYTQLQEFNQAYDAFDSAIDLAPEHEYAYLNRGIALYYGGRAALAAEDLNSFHKLSSNDPYRILWLYLADNVDNEIAAKETLARNAHLVANDVWAKSIIQLYLGELNQERFLAELTNGVKSSLELSERLCEAYFYLGKFYQNKNQNNVAETFFKLSLSTNVYEFVEHRYAKLELDLMRETTVNLPNGE